MNTIKFSHKYCKMPYPILAKKSVVSTTLLEIFLKGNDDLSPEFIVYDTEILGGGFYEVPEGKLIVLLLLTESPVDNYLWTTIRRFTIEKYLRYKNLRGKTVQIEIAEPDAPYNRDELMKRLTKL